MQLVRPAANIWPLVKPMIEKACQRNNGRYDADNVKEWLDKGAWQLWIAKDGEKIKALCLTEIAIYPKMKVLRVNMVTGYDRQEWQHAKNLIEYWGKEMGCQKIESIARKGWGRIFKDYQQTHIFIEKEL